MEREKRSRTRHSRREIVRAILALGLTLTCASSVRAQRALVTRRGTGAPPVPRAAELPPAQDLATDGLAMRRDRKPMLLFFDREECPYCEQALREYLVPLLREPGGQRVLLRQVEIDREQTMSGFDGKPTTHRAFAERYGVMLSPTVLLVDAGGRRLADPIVGLMPDFYGAYLERAIEEALARLP